MQREDIRLGRGSEPRAPEGCSQWGAVSPELQKNTAKGEQNQVPRREAPRQASKKKMQKASHQRTQSCMLQRDGRHRLHFQGCIELTTIVTAARHGTCVG